MPALLDEPRDAFWSRYNRRSELPLSAATAVLVHTLVAALVVLTLGWFMHSPAKSPVIVEFIPDLGTDDDGVGSPGASGEPNELRPGVALQNPDFAQPLPISLPKPEAAQPAPKINEGPLPVPMANADFGKADAAIQNKQPGAGKGDGPAKGSGAAKGMGPGGDGTDTTRARSQRWVLRFRTEDGADYLRQLAALKAEVLVPLPPDEKKGLHVPDLRDVAKQQAATAEDLKRLAGLVRFTDMREESVRGVCEALKVDAKAKSFHAYFPKELEEQLAKKEIGYRNRRFEDIEQTIFQIQIRGGAAVIVVIDQAVKK